MKAFEKLMEKKQIVTFPSEGYCRIPNCRDYYDRKNGGRKGMCNFHYHEMEKLIRDEGHT